MDTIYEAVIHGEPASKANSRRIVQHGNISRSIKSKKAIGYSKLFGAQTVTEDGLFNKDVAVYAKVWYCSRRPDLDESLILDLLQDVAYANDRQVRAKLIFWGKDKENPRTHLIVVPIEQVGELFDHTRDEHLVDWEEPRRK